MLVEKSHMRKFEEVHALTGLRGFAALWVFIYHFWVLQVSSSVVISVLGLKLDITFLFSFGWLGVTIFFVLSAFLLAQPFVESASQAAESNKTEKIDLIAYFFRRIARVFPAYYVQLFILSLIAFFFQFGSHPQGLASWIAHLTMTIFSPPFFIDGIVGVWWTLPIEFSFYIALPLFVALFKPKRGLVILAVCLAIMVFYRYLTYRMYLGTDVPLYTRINLLPGMMDAFGIGMFGAYFAFHFKKNGAKYANFLTLAMLLVFGGCLALLNRFWMYYWSGGLLSYTFSVVFSLAIVMVAIGSQWGSSWAHWLFGNPVIRFFGMISYSFYLWHIPVINFVNSFPSLQEIGAHKNLVLLILCIVLLTILSWVSWRFIENPAINWCKQMTSKRTASLRNL